MFGPELRVLLELKDILCFPTAPSNQTFFDAVSAVGLTALSNVKKDAGLMVLARQKYVGTLQNVGLALKSHTKADVQGTLKSIVMLALFEVGDSSLSPFRVTLTIVILDR